MAANEVLVNRVRGLLPVDLAVEEKRMFGGMAFMVRGKMCITVGSEKKNRFMFRIDPAMHDRLAEGDGCQTMVSRGREFRGYIQVDADVLRSDRDLKRWIGLALEFNGQIA